MSAGALQLRHFEAMLEGTGIEVRASSLPGTDMRGVFARESEAEGALLYTEVPLACWLAPSLREVQEYHVRSLLAGGGGGAARDGPREAPALLRCCNCLAVIPPGSAVPCDKCPAADAPGSATGRACLEVYCSVACREKASVLYHAMTCPDLLAAAGASQQLEALEQLEKLSDPGLPFTPRVVLRVLAGLFSRALAALLQTEDEVLSLEYAFAPYARLFGSSRVSVEDYPMDEAYAWTRAFFEDVSGCYARAAPTITFGEHGFELTRQTFLAPEFYAFLVSTLCFNSLAVAMPVAVPAAPSQKSRSPFRPGPLQEDVVGAALFQCLSNLNHSCEPSCQIDFLEGTSEGTLRLLHSVKAGEELFITYVCVDEPLTARRERLAPYQFVCHCPKCEREEREEREAREEAQAGAQAGEGGGPPAAGSPPPQTL